MKLIAMLWAFLLMAGWFFDLKEADKVWDQANKYYQVELYEESLPLFKKALGMYIQEEDKEMITTTQICLGWNYLLVGKYAMAEKIAYQIEWKWKVEDAAWNRSLADLFGHFGDDKMQVKYLRRAGKYE